MLSLAKIETRKALDTVMRSLAYPACRFNDSRLLSMECEQALQKLGLPPAPQTAAS